ncbi:PD-(D/E)XK nuclease family protein [Glutamicibacter sp. MNS18]|uniref:PD-(D/E)XK nuclease family protein n=1 Tax=Glutamicibacter sp. MNS18 TaxID=2989817 RepID=UPI002236638E|nr:PD-(D/E)XK nuclease family protein [Glutamicibacter sp. MNS18]MCW4464511.1 PD-(D/E)XK nuclease family protein [Glutamicibacter sp. MNS18]
MTTPKLATQTELGRMYARQVGGQVSVPSITTVIGVEHMDLTGWAGYMAAKSLAEHGQLAEALGDQTRMRRLVRESASASEQYRDQTATRGDRVHDYAEQFALGVLGEPNELRSSREQLAAKDELGFARSLEAWWKDYRVEPIAAEVTVWNETVGYAGTIDLIARVGGRLALVDYKTKGTDRDGQVKSPDAKVIMQLVAAAKAEERSVDPVAGLWEAWPYGTDVMLLAVALGEGGSRTFMAPPASLPGYWSKFWALHRSWKAHYELARSGQGLTEIGPPPGTVEQLP